MEVKCEDKNDRVYKFGNTKINIIVPKIIKEQDSKIKDNINIMVSEFYIIK